MRVLQRVLTLCGVLGALGGCPSQVTVRNPYLSYTEEYGVAGTGVQLANSGAATGTGTEAAFRRSLTLRLRNNNADAELNTTLMSWVNVSSIRTAEQQDALLRDGYVQLTQELDLGSVFALPVGTYVYTGSGSGTSTSVFLAPAIAGQTNQGTQQNGQTGTQTPAAASTPTVMTITLTTPDAIVVFDQPPVSCDSVAFYYTQNGAPLPSTSPGGGGTAPFGGSNTSGGYKTLAQVNVYQCSPLRPGVFLSQGGSGRQQNEYIEGEDVTFDFNATADASGNFCIVQFGTPTSPTAKAIRGRGLLPGLAWARVLLPGACTMVAGIEPLVDDASATAVVAGPAEYTWCLAGPNRMTWVNREVQQ